MDGFARCAYRRLELAHVYRDTANELCSEDDHNPSVKFFRNKAYYEKVRASALLEMLADIAHNKSMESQQAANNQLTSPPETERFLC
ncbi:hypothetical protein E0E54_04085 [Azotobacter chroococcum]|uniref:hypothetical protein n=1 Tax=Azotobacter chroococcum TaxID=353 RepID=UPI00103A00CD|nr:hypothetical protein [Azotobacter chroococcum]TBW07060.1 hypothetical protein E0E50_17770 [Azotobacter chroococcum subsp. isscasi]TBW08444.1 hypothetical protein E0E52_09505 [Azotobacter chroococcum]TBW38920.1 hypothetical protein E0E54_04085 [Azotobacter chroococcum]